MMANILERTSVIQLFKAAMENMSRNIHCYFLSLHLKLAIEDLEKNSEKDIQLSTRITIAMFPDKSRGVDTIQSLLEQIIQNDMLPAKQVQANDGIRRILQSLLDNAEPLSPNSRKQLCLLLERPLEAPAPDEAGAAPPRFTR